MLKDEIKIIHLPEIGDNIYVGNVHSAIDAETLNDHKIAVIINFSDYLLSNRNINIHNITYKDTRNLDYHRFTNILLQAANIINNNPNKNILIVCNKGVNRSVSIAIGYAILNKKYTFDNSYEYVETQKLKKYKTWHSLTNQRIKHLLRACSVVYSL